jgi:hypothetical protein
MLTIWYLIFWIGHEPIEGGQYQTRARCEAAVVMQMPFAKKRYGNQVTWECTTVRHPRST